MQPAPATPAPAPSAPQPPSPSTRPTAVSLPDGPVPLQGTPNSVQELQGLRERREMLRDQLDRATNRRSDLVSELNPEGDRPLAPEARAGIQQRLDLLDARILQIERDQALTERLLSNAPPDLLAQEAVAQARVTRRDTVDQDEAIGLSFGTFGLGVLLTLIVGRIRRRLARRRMGARGVRPDGTPAALSDDPRIDRLAHAVDAIAEEVERIGEGQRFVTQLLAQRQEAPAAALPGEPAPR